MFRHRFQAPLATHDYISLEPDLKQVPVLVVT
jgi:hypothetical protein